MYIYMYNLDLCCNFFYLLTVQFEFEQVSVPCSNLFEIMTVRCGHCTNVCYVDMGAAFQYSMSSKDVQIPACSSLHCKLDLGSSSSKCKNKRAPPANPTTERIVNRPPEKRHRTPSLYNQFIKEEIHRIKVNNPEISHREAFSTAAKNWARFPHINLGLMLESSNQGPEQHLI